MQCRSGIYAIINIVNGKFYVGSACNFRERWSNHIRGLNKGTHYSVYLQSAWNKYGKENFYFGVLEPVENIEDLVGREDYWIKYFDAANPKIGYNICPTAGSLLGYKFTEESRQKMSKNNRGEKNPMYGRTGEKSPSYQHAKCWEYEGKSQPLSDWAKEYNISRTTLAFRVKEMGWSLERALTTPVLSLEGENNSSYQRAKCWKYNGKSQPLSDWAKEYGINRTTLNFRVNVLGWSFGRALDIPIVPRDKNKLSIV